MSLYNKRVSELGLDGVDIVVDPLTKVPSLVAGRELTVLAGDKRLKVTLSKDGQHLEIEYLTKSGISKPEPVLRMSL
jgi:hypothetical protein